MEKQVRDNIRLLIKDGEEIEHVTFGILLSFKRNIFFTHLANYITFYNTLIASLENSHKNKKTLINSLEKIPSLHYKNYSISPLIHCILLITFPVSFILFIIQWNYIKEIKRKLTIGLNEFHAILKGQK